MTSKAWCMQRIIWPRLTWVPVWMQHVSDDCKDLLRGLLTADPSKRLTVAQVQNHAWFRQDLPAGALEVNSRLKLMDNVR